MRVLSLLVALSMSFAGAHASTPSTPGTNGAGESRSWTISGAPSVRAAFLQVVDGMVTLSHTENAHVTLHHGNCGRLNTQSVSQTYTQQVPITVPLANLSASDRRWIEEKNPCETCLTAKSRKGAVGTLAPKTGFYRVTDITDDDTAMVEYVCGKKTVWSFVLRSRLVQHMTPAEKYDTIACDLVPHFDTLSKSRKEQFGIDFRVTDMRTPSGKHVVLLEDFR